MSSWGRSFIVALKAWVIGFTLSLIVMAVFGFLGYMLMQGAVIILSYPPYYSIDPLALGAGVTVFAVGGFISGLVMYVSIVKYTVEESVREIERRIPLQPSAPDKTCQKCGKPVPTNAEYCMQCGSKLT